MFCSSTITIKAYTTVCQRSLCSFSTVHSGQQTYQQTNTSLVHLQSIIFYSKFQFNLIVIRKKKSKHSPNPQICFWLKSLSRWLCNTHICKPPSPLASLSDRDEEPSTWWRECGGGAACPRGQVRLHPRRGPHIPHPGGVRKARDQNRGHKTRGHGGVRC